MLNSTIDLHFLFFLCVTNLSQNSLLDASTDEAENEFAKYQLGLSMLLRWMLLRRRITSGSINTVLNYLNTVLGNIALKIKYLNNCLCLSFFPLNIRTALKKGSELNFQLLNWTSSFNQPTLNGAYLIGTRNDYIAARSIIRALNEHEPFLSIVFFLTCI